MALSLLLDGPVVAQGAAGVVRGRVIDADSGSPIAGATVALRPSGKRARSAANGAFSIVGVTPGTYALVCTKAGYKRATARGLKMSAGGSIVHVCRMKRVQKPKEKESLADRKPAPAPMRDERARVSRKRAAYAVGGAIGMGSYGRTRPLPENYNREGYDHRAENDFVVTSDQPRSTFSIDVDTASYSNIRRFIEKQGTLPPKDAVKIEEMINYFSYDYPEPKGDVPFSVDTELSRAPWNDAHRLVRIGVQGKRLPVAKLPASNLVFLLDVSGSMGSPDKLPLLKSALGLLVDNMRERDRVAIVVYAGAAGLVLPSTSGEHKDRILAALEELRAGGSTAGAQGIELAYRVARQNFIRGGNNRVILATDGDFNVGVSSDGELTRLIEKKRKQGVFLTVLGFGTGNYQDAKMEKLADNGNGNHAYIDSLQEARKVLVTEMGGTLFTIAKDVKLQIEFNPSKVKAYRLIGYENRMLKTRDFNDDKKDAGELGAGHSVTALYEIIPAGSNEAVAGVDELKYQKVQKTAAASSGELMTVKLRYKKPDGDKSRLIEHPVADHAKALSKTSNDFRFATAVAELGLILSDSKHKGAASYEALIRRARGAIGQDDGGYRHAFLKLARKAQALGTTHTIAH